MHRWIVFALISLVAIEGAAAGCLQNDPSGGGDAYKNVKLSLNNGRKWQVPKDMMEHIDASFALLSSFEKDEGEMNYGKLYADLNGHKNKFVSKCSMKGKSHEVLHSWLVPYMGLLHDLNSTHSKEKKEEIIQELQYSKKLFYQYFESM